MRQRRRAVLQRVPFCLHRMIIKICLARAPVVLELRSKNASACDLEETTREKARKREPARTWEWTQGPRREFGPSVRKPPRARPHGSGLGAVSETGALARPHELFCNHEKANLLRTFGWSTINTWFFRASKKMRSKRRSKRKSKQHIANCAK